MGYLVSFMSQCIRCDTAYLCIEEMYLFKRVRLCKQFKSRCVSLRKKGLDKNCPLIASSQH